MIGILALQWNVLEHRLNLAGQGAKSRDIRRSGDLEGIDGLILPGGESTAMRILISSSGLHDEVKKLIGREIFCSPPFIPSCPRTAHRPVTSWKW